MMMRDELNLPDRDQNSIVYIFRSGWMYLAFMVLSVFAFTVWYVSQETAFNWSDYNYYHAGAKFVLKELNHGPLLLIWLSTTFAHNLLYTLPILAVEAIFGSSRLTFITSLVGFYFLPFVLFMAAVGSRLSKTEPIPAFWITALVTVSIPVIWAPALRGVPDHLAAGMMALAIYIYLGERTYVRGRKVLYIGALIAMAAICRRHYLYECIAFAFAVCLHQFVRIWQSATKPTLSSYLRECLLPLVRIGFVSSFLFGTVGFFFLGEILTHDWSKLDRSLEVAPQQVLTYFVLSYGSIPSLLALLGLILAFRTRSVDKLRLLFVVTFSLFLIVVWCLVPKLIAIHFPLHASLLVDFGLSCLMLVVREFFTAKKRLIATCGFSFILILNMFVGLATDVLVGGFRSHQVRFGETNLPERKGDLAGSLLSADYSPRVRPDRKLVIDLADYLYGIVSPEKLVYVAGAGEILNADILRNAEFEQHGDDQHVRFVETANTDSMDSYPLESLLRSDYVVTVKPLSIHVDPSEQKVVQVVNDCFDNDWEFARDFSFLTHLPLGSGFNCKIYKRLRPTQIPVAVRFLTKMRAFVTTPPAGQSPFIDSSHTSGMISPNRKAFTVELHAARPEFLLSAAPFRQGEKISVRFDSDCLSRAQFTYSLFDDAGKKIADTPILVGAPAKDKVTGKHIVEYPIVVEHEGFVVIGAQLKKDHANPDESGNPDEHANLNPNANPKPDQNLQCELTVERL